MKKQRTKKWVRTLAILWCVGALAACNSERQTTGETTSSDDIEFAFVQESFGSEHAVTRSVRVTDTLADTLDLGGGLSAEISVATDTATIAPTRAPLSDGAYTIVVADAATHLPIAGKKLTGTVTGGTFKADNVLQIAAGTYDFVCFSEGVAEENGQLVVKNGAKSPMIGVVKGVVLSGRKQKVSFAMKHQTARVRLQINSYTAAGIDVQASLSSDAGKRIAEVFDYQGVSAGTRTGVVSTGEAYVCTPVPQAYTSVSKVFKSTSEYQYLIDGIALSDLKLNFTAGTMHGTALAGKQQSLSNATVLQKNGSYLVNITFKKKAPFCLFNDGTIGYAGDKTATRVPIALVVKEKSTESAKDGMAIALHNAGSGRYPLTTLSLPNINTEAYAWNRLQDFLNDERGYYWTYDKAASVQPNTVKAERETDYPAFYQAAHYTPNVSVPINGIGKWYLPAAGEWKLFIEKLGQTTVSASGGAGIGIGANPTPNLTQMAAWFTEAGGEIDVNWSQWYLISTEYETSTMIAAVPYGMYNNFPQRDGWFVRPFVHFLYTVKRINAPTKAVGAFILLQEDGCKSISSFIISI